MSEAHARAWWAEVEHLQEAAERRSAERAKARIEGREPVALTPLQPLAFDALAAFEHALDAAEPVAVGEAPRARRFARETAIEPEEARGHLTLVTDRAEEAPERSRGAARAAAPSRPARSAPPRRPASIPANVPHAGRRTVEIRGHAKAPVVELVPDQSNTVGPARRRPRRTVAERCVGSPDRVALYAVLLGMFLILVALLSAHGG